MRLIDADALLVILRKSHESHAENSREESLLERDIRIVKEQAKYHPQGVTLGMFLDLINRNRDSEERVRIMGANGDWIMRAMVCYDNWDEDRVINSIGIEDGEYEVWLEPREESERND